MFENTFAESGENARQMGVSSLDLIHNVQPVPTCAVRSASLLRLEVVGTGRRRAPREAAASVVALRARCLVGGLLHRHVFDALIDARGDPRGPPRDEGPRWVDPPLLWPKLRGRSQTPRGQQAHDANQSPHR